MGQINPNGTYQGRVYDAGASNNAVLTITASDPQTGNISSARMDYYNMHFNVTGHFTYRNLSIESSVSFNLIAEADDAEHTLLAISMESPDRSYKNLTGSVSVQRGRPNAGKTYNIEFKK